MKKYGASNMVKSGIAHLPTISNSHTWSIYSGANRQMKGFSRDFLIYFPCTKEKNIRISNGSYTLISITNSINCTPTITLSSILYISSFLDRFLSISTITRDFNYKIKIFLITASFKIFKHEN